MQSRFTRRNMIAKAGAGTGLALAAAAELTTAGLATADRAHAAQAPEKFTTNEYWAQKGSVKLYVYRKRLDSAKPAGGRSVKPVLFLVHGSSNSGRSSYDLATPGKGEYSMMNAFARLGYDVWTMDHENYGRSGRTDSNSDIASGAEDLKAASDVIAKETGQQKIHLLGESSGALRVGVFAVNHPERVDRIVLSAFTYKGENSPTLTERAKQLEYYKTHNRRKRDRDMIRSIFTRDKPGTSETAIGEFLADEELKFGEEVPTGTYLDMTSKLPLVDPKKVQTPVLLIRGEYDGIATVNDLMDFYTQLPTGDRQFVILPGMAHNLVLGLNRQLFWHAVHSFLAMPKSIYVS
jgi:alpha-beta hydrolase superfamily lysophospholipase